MVGAGASKINASRAGKIVSAVDRNDSPSTIFQRLGTRSARTIAAVVRDVRCLCFVFRNPGTPWYARALLFLPLAYLCSPVQLIPNFIPVLGQMDDVLVIWLSMKLARRLVSARVLAECSERAAAVSFSIRFSGRSFYVHHRDRTSMVASTGKVGSATPSTEHKPAAIIVQRRSTSRGSVHAGSEAAEIGGGDPDKTATRTVDVRDHHDRDRRDDGQREQEPASPMQRARAVGDHDVGEQRE